MVLPQDSHGCDGVDADVDLKGQEPLLSQYKQVLVI